MKNILEAIAALNDIEAAIIGELNNDGINPLDYERQCKMCGKEQRAVSTLTDKEL